jgi:hypothetical protein
VTLKLSAYKKCMAASNANFLREKAQGILKIEGITKDGANWVSKALHPSDNVTDVRGLPTNDSVASAAVNYMSTFIISAPPTQASTATWDVVISLWHHPYCFGKAYAVGTDALGAPIYATTFFLNQQIGGANMKDAAIGLSQLTDFYRGTFAGHTTTLTAPALSNQGTVTATQFTVQPNIVTPQLAMTSPVCAGVKDHRDSPNIPANIMMRPAAIYPNLWGAARFNFSALQGTSGAFTAEARAGTYSPHKLDQETFTYKSSKCTSSQFTMVDELTNFPVPVAWVPQTLMDLKPIHPFADDFLIGTQTTTGYAVHEPCSHNMSIVYYRGLSAAGTVTVTTRQGFEFLVPTTSTLLPSVTRAMSYDTKAIDAYFAISREMNCAYPAEYNFLGLLWNVVSGIGKAVLPKLLPALGGILGSAVGKNIPSTVVNQPNSGAFMQGVTNFVNSATKKLNKRSGSGQQPKQQKQKSKQLRPIKQRVAPRRILLPAANQRYDMPGGFD